MILPLILYPRTHLLLLDYKEADFKKEEERVQAPGEGVASFNTFTNYHMKNRRIVADCRPYIHHSFSLKDPSSSDSYQEVQIQEAYCFLASEDSRSVFNYFQFVGSLNSRTISQL
jgi:hypothetical protein